MTATKRERVKESVVKSLALGASVLAACAGVQIGRSTFYRWLDGDASFEESVMMARLGLVEEVMSELRLLAFGRYVEEEKIVETATGPRKEWRKRWRDGKVSALMAILKSVEKDLAGMEEWRGKMTNDRMTNDQCGEDDLGLSVAVSQVSQSEGRMTNDQCPNDQFGRGDLGLSVAVSQVSQNSLESGADGSDGMVGGGEAMRVAAGAGASHIEAGRKALSVGVSQVSQNSLKTGGVSVVRESRQARRLRERQEFKAAKAARKAGQKG